MAKILYPTRQGEGVHRHSSIDQFAEFLSVMKKGGWTPIVFDQLDGIACETINTHPVVISFEKRPLGYVFPDGECRYSSSHFITVDKYGVEYKPLPAIFGGDGEFYAIANNSNSFVNFDGSSLGLHNQTTLRVGQSVVLADETLPAVE